MFKLPGLTYDKNSLEPYMSEKTLDFHHGKHHQAYFTKLNELISGTKWEDKSSFEDLIKIVKESYQEKNAPLFNNAAQAYNHIVFWETLKGNGGGEPSDFLLEKIKKFFGSYDEFLKIFKEKGMGQFGSGWVWLSQNASGELKVDKYLNGENPLIKDETPLFGIDVWEHAYYLDYQNRRPDYIDGIMKNLVNWDAVEARLK